jgi:hypothetical protein
VKLKTDELGASDSSREINRKGILQNPFHPPLMLRQKPSKVFDRRLRRCPSAKVLANAFAIDLTQLPSMRILFVCLCLVGIFCLRFKSKQRKKYDAEMRRFSASTRELSPKSLNENPFRPSLMLRQKPSVVFDC